MRGANGGKDEEPDVGLSGDGQYRLGRGAVLAQNAAVIAHRDEMTFTIKKALVRSLDKARNTPLGPEVFTTRPEEVVADPQIQIVVELLGGLHPARELMLQALEHGKTVVTANKAVLATYWHEFEAAARQSGAGLYYEASVCGGIPIINVLTRSMQANRIGSMMGIVNGTTNYILTKMSEEGRDYADVLAEAQRLGLAEPDPPSTWAAWTPPTSSPSSPPWPFTLGCRWTRCLSRASRPSRPRTSARARSWAIPSSCWPSARSGIPRCRCGCIPPSSRRGIPLQRARQLQRGLHSGRRGGRPDALWPRGGDLPTASAIISISSPPPSTPITPTAPSTTARRLAGPLLPGELDLRVLRAPDGAGPARRALAHRGHLQPAERVHRLDGAEGPRRRRGALIFVTHDTHEQGMERAIGQIRQLEQVLAVNSVIRVES